MAYIRLVYRLAGLTLIQIVMGAIGLAGVIVLIPFRRARYAYTLWSLNMWGRMCCFIMSIHIRKEGSAERANSGTLIVSNHIGSLDIFVVAACFKAFFVSKSDVKSWPLVGLLTQLAGTIYIDRARKTQVLAMVRELARRLKDGWSITVFPEGGVTSGNQVEHFKSSVFEAVIQSKGTVTPVMIRYYEVGDPSVACWTDGQTFFENLMALLMHPRLTAQVAILPEVQGETDRRALAQKSRERIGEKFQETA